MYWKLTLLLILGLAIASNSAAVDHAAPEDSAVEGPALRVAAVPDSPQAFVDPFQSDTAPGHTGDSKKEDAANPGGSTNTSDKVTTDKVIAVEPRPAEAVELFSCGFGQNWDQNFDNWPDRWVREHSIRYPHYLPIKLVTTPAPRGDRALRVELNGGAAAVHSPAINVDSMYTYVVEGYARTEKLVHDEAFLAITFYDEENVALETEYSQRIGSTTPWTKLTIGPIAPKDVRVHHAVITLHVAPTNKVDLNGRVWFSDIWLGRLPRMSLAANRRSHIYLQNEQPEITCEVSGFSEDRREIHFELVDLEGKVVRRETKQLIPSTAPRRSHLAKAGEDLPRIFAGNAVWKPKVPKVGFYRARAEMPGRTEASNQSEITLAVLDSQPPPAAGEFGWTLPTAEKPLTLLELAEVMGQSGINWAKFPLWDESKPADREEQLISFAERVGLRRIELIGLLCTPPPELRKQLSGAEMETAAGIFSAPPELWHPSLEPIMSRLSLKVRWWQLGLDRDQSFVGYPELAQKISLLKKQFSRYGQRVHIGLGWSWLREVPPGAPTWDYLNFSAEPALNWEEQLEYLQAVRTTGAKRFVVLDPLPRDQYALNTRAQDLAMRMLSAKMGGAEGIFVPELFNDQTGLMNNDGTVGELFMPWRTTALALAGAKSVGSLQLPGNVSNQVFARGDEYVIALWSDRPAEVTLLLGDEVQQVDLWGRSTVVPIVNGQQSFQVGELPIFLTHLNSALLQTQMSVRFENNRLPSLFGKPLPNGLTIRNAFGQSMRGQVRLDKPDVWRVSPKDMHLKISAGETLVQQLEFTLPINVATGRQTVRLDFDVTTDKRYQFSIYRQIEIGLSDIYAEATTRVNEKGDLEVEQRLTNETNAPVSFKCYLYVPGRKRMTQFVEDHGRGVDIKTFRLTGGEALLGETLYLRAEEVNGSRILNYRVVVQR
ncbi:MAG: hypothetical protein SGJ20_19710 [Planctomycetota bacterium]|nr:hypothetical protein [Planctomycetota bacterium]